MQVADAILLVDGGVILGPVQQDARLGDALEPVHAIGVGDGGVGVREDNVALAGPDGVADVLAVGVLGGGLQLGGAADGVDDVVAVWSRGDGDGGGESAHGLVVAAGRVSRREDDVVAVAVGIAVNFVAGREEGGGGDAEDGGNGEESGGAGGRHGRFGEEIVV